MDANIAQDIHHLLVNRYLEDYSREQRSDLLDITECLGGAEDLSAKIAGYASNAGALIAGLHGGQPHQNGNEDLDCGHGMALTCASDLIKQSFGLQHEGESSSKCCHSQQLTENRRAVISIKASDYIEEVLFMVASLLLKDMEQSSLHDKVCNTFSDPHFTS